MTAKLEAEQLSVLLDPAPERAAPEPELAELELSSGEPAAPPPAAGPTRLAHTLRRPEPAPVSAHDAKTQPMRVVIEPEVVAPSREQAVWLGIAVACVVFALGLLVVAV